MKKATVEYIDGTTRTYDYDYLQFVGSDKWLDAPSYSEPVGRQQRTIVILNHDQIRSVTVHPHETPSDPVGERIAAVISTAAKSAKPCLSGAN